MPLIVKIFIIAISATAFIIFFNPKISPPNESGLKNDELARYSTCQFEFLYPQQWGKVIKSQSQQYFTDSERTYVTTNTYKFGNYDDGLIRLSDNNVGLFWLSVSPKEWVNYEPHKVNANNFCDYIQKYRLVNGEYDTNDKINACEIINDTAIMGWSAKDYPEDADKFLLAGFKELFTEKFSGVTVVIESKRKLDDKDKLQVKKTISSIKIKEGECL